VLLGSSSLKAARKILVKLTPNFFNILSPIFSPIFLRQNIGAKCARKKLVKLTPVGRSTIQL